MAQSKVSGTIEQALQLVDEGSKVVIFTSYNEPLNMMSRALTEREIGFVRVDGNVVDAKEKMVLATRFQQDPECMVFIANIKAAGHTIPLHVSSVIFILNQTLTPKEIEQAIARLEHIDKKDPITIYYPTCLGESNEETVDMRLTSLNAGKLLDIDAVVDGGKDINNLENISEMLFESMKKEYENYESNPV
jgi:SNF2 family DNA or RNA helicase